tara:strand:- start:4589 stop:4795 length:207 start_codon:yes stop_codon:yes gene_type:complete
MKGFASASSTRPPTAKQIAFIKENYADVPATFEEASKLISHIIQTEDSMEGLLPGGKYGNLGYDEVPW